MIKPYQIFKTVILDTKYDSNMNEAEIECAFGCNREKHAIDIVELFYVDGEIVYGNHLSSHEIGKCTCYDEETKNWKGGFILDNQIYTEGCTIITDFSTLETTYLN